MTTEETNRTTRAHELKDELARLSLPGANRDADVKLAWVNSVCIVILLIGLVGARRGLIAIQPVPPLVEIIPTVIEPITLPPQETTEQKDQPKEEKPEVPQVVVVALPTPNITFAIPTIGTLVVPTALATAPGLNARETAEWIGRVGVTGASGERPQPPYPKIALEGGQQGMVRLTLSGDDAGTVTAVEVRESSGFPILDRGTVEFIKHHWRLPAGGGSRIFETSVRYRLQSD